MKTYRIKRAFATILSDVKGLHMTSTNCWESVNVTAFDNRFLRNFNASKKLTTLPRNCNRELVNIILEQMQSDKTPIEQVRVLRKYLKCAEKKDKNDEIKSNLKQALKQVFLGLLLVVVGGVGGFALMLLLLSLWPASTSGISFLIIPIVAAATYGIIKAGVGCLKLVFGIFSFCSMSQKNIDQLPLLENALRGFCLQSSQPPSYHEVMTTLPTAPGLYFEELPTYQQAVSLSENRSHLFHHPQFACNNNNVNSLPVSRHNCH